MKKRLYVIIVLVILLKTASAQMDENRDFIYFFSDSILVGNIEYKSPIFGIDYLLLNSNKVLLDRVKFYKKGGGFYANTNGAAFRGSPDFTKRIREGKINLYEKVNVNTYTGHFTPSGAYMGGGGSVTILNYYNKGYDDLKRANYKNLSFDLADNPESLIHLGKYKKVQNTQTGLYIAGGAAILVGIVTLVAKTDGVDYDNEPSPDVSANLAAIGVGAFSCFISYTLSFSKPGYLRKAVDTYNR